MAKPVSFKPQLIDPHEELMRRVEAAPRDHAEALLVAWDTLQSAHDKGILELVQGMIEGRDIIAGRLAAGMKNDETVQALRNTISAARLLASIDPSMLQRMAKAFEADPPREEKKAPGIFALIRRAFSADTRRGLGFMLSLIGKVGSATKTEK